VLRVTVWKFTEL